MNLSRSTFRLVRSGFALLVIAGASLVWGAAASTSGPSPENSAKLQVRIEKLLKRKLKLESLPIDPPNPFQLNMSGTITREPIANDDGSPRAPRSEEAGAASTGPSNIDILTSIVPRLKFGGIISQKDTTKVVINGVPRREGDMVPADWNNTVVYLKVLKLTNTDVVLRYNDADAKLSF